MEKELKRGGGYVELGDHVVVRILGPEVGLGVTVFFVVSVGRVAVDGGLVVIVVDSVVGDAVGAEVTLRPRLCYKTSNYFLLSRSVSCYFVLWPRGLIKHLLSPVLRGTRIDNRSNII